MLKPWEIVEMKRKSKSNGALIGNWVRCTERERLCCKICFVVGYVYDCGQLRSRYERPP